MATLNWIGKEAVVNHDKEVPFKLLEKVPSASVGKESKNLIIHGDNLEALKALMPFYKDKVKCIYIDPPYNTGNYTAWKKFLYSIGIILMVVFGTSIIRLFTAWMLGILN